MYCYLKFFLLCFVFLFSKRVGAGSPYADEFFHHFDVGQGSCQLVIYRFTDENQVGVMYDVGTSSQQQHLKFQQNPQKKEIISNAPQPTFDFFEETASKDSFLSSGNDSAATTISADTQRRSTSIINTIQEKIKRLNHLFVFLSHPDRDHINLLKDVVPSNINVTVFLCGDWLGDGGANDKYDDVSIYVKGVLNFLIQRIQNRGPGCGKTSFSLPYYWNSLSRDYKNIEICYKDIKKALVAITTKSTDPVAKESRLRKEKMVSRTKYFFDLFKINFQKKRHIPPQIFKGNLSKLLGYAIGQGDISIEDAVYLANIQGMETVFNYVYIWSLNQSADDTNNQSAIVSCSLPDRKMSFVFSGDAHDLVFKNAGLDEYEKDEADKIRKILEKEDHLVWLTLPHHGSSANESFFAWDLFKPSGILISAGNYKDFGHPSYNLVSRIAKTKSKIWNWGMRVKDKNYRFLAYDKTKTGKNAVRTGELDGEHIPILCPNIMGSISIVQQDGYFYINQEGFSPVLEDDNKLSYLVEYNRQLPGTWNLIDGKLKNRTVYYTHLGNNIYENSANFVWVVNELNEVIVYEAKLLEGHDK